MSEKVGSHSLANRTQTPDGKFKANNGSWVPTGNGYSVSSNYLGTKPYRSTLPFASLCLLCDLVYIFPPRLHKASTEHTNAYKCLGTTNYRTLLITKNNMELLNYVSVAQISYQNILKIYLKHDLRTIPSQKMYNLISDSIYGGRCEVSRDMQKSQMVLSPHHLFADHCHLQRSKDTAFLAVVFNEWLDHATNSHWADLKRVIDSNLAAQPAPARPLWGSMGLYGALWALAQLAAAKRGWNI
ncbi:hypothetical protein PROFUN_16335 [Planoprotostelium fungivorum]|uniref:Uncharacterized protein n=1 Tax=Planoprotostelium fungivorum TaxID=1890364 RepID=A0A2P6MR72_9EUKA|nr:hypothetical protein PROFUN_16335 [Planoprotostelium fungivorum]